MSKVKTPLMYFYFVKKVFFISYEMIIKATNNKKNREHESI